VTLCGGFLCHIGPVSPGKRVYSQGEGGLLLLGDPLTFKPAVRTACSGEQLAR